MNLRLLADYACNTGEGPLWHPEEQAVYWTDIPNGKVFRLDWSSGRHGIVYTGEPVGGMTLQHDGGIALFGARGHIRLMRKDGFQILVEKIEGEEDNRFNDVIADPAGRVFAGTMSTPNRRGKLYRIDPDLTITPVVENVGCANGMGFSGDRTRFYFVDSTAHTVSVFDYDENSGEIAHPRPFVETHDIAGVPDGMTVDADDHVWVAFWDGRCIVRYDPEGVEVLRVAFAVKKVSCLTFGGPDHTDMLVTTAGGHDKAENGPDAGALFHLRTGHKGRPEFRSRLGS